MIRSGNIPPVLNRICDKDTIHSALLVTTDGELMGVSSCNTNNNNNFFSREDPEAIGTLLADIGVDYQKLGEEFAALVQQQQQRRTSHLQCLLIELDLGLVGISSCLGIDCLVIAIAKPETPPGLLKAKLEALVAHAQESFSPLTEGAGR